MASRIIGFRATEEQIAGYELAAKKANMPVSEWARKLCDVAAGELSSTGFHKDAFTMVWPAVGHDVKVTHEDGSQEIITIAEQEQAIQSAYPQSVLEHAAKAEAPIGKSVTEFLLKTAPKITIHQELDILLPGHDDPDYEGRCIKDFGKKILEQAARSLPGWKKLTWEQRHAKLKEQRDGTSADGW